MRSIFIGYMFTFLNININFGHSTLDILPDFIGFWFIIKGLKELAHESNFFEKVLPLAKFMMVYTAALWIMNLIGIAGTDNTILTIVITVLGLISLAISLLLSFNIIQGVKEIEFNHFTSLESGPLEKAWKIMAIAEVATFLLAVIVPPLSVVSLIVAFIFAIVFLVRFNRSKNLYEQITL